MSSKAVDGRLVKGQSTRERILDVARRMFQGGGYEATAIETILSECDLSRGALYHHFESKEQLFEAVFIAIEEEITRKAMAVSASESDPVARLRAGYRAFL